MPPPDQTICGLAPLAVLPVFVPLAGRRALVLGGSAAAAWKARLLASTGAKVEVFARTVSQEMRDAAGTGPIGVHERDWSPNDLAGSRLVVVALEEDGEAECAVAAARAAGAIVNAVDRPHLCDVQFGAIVNRSPLVVGISTDGAAPVVAQLLRARIEALLPARVASWLAVAKTWRERVKARLPFGVARRVFWQTFAERAFLDPGRAPREQDLEELFAETERDLRGREVVSVVSLSSERPNDLSERDLRLLLRADIVVHDADVPPGILELTRREARTIPDTPSSDGKRSASIVPSEIADGKCVVRLTSSV